jgi:hypothetical protein
VSGPVTFRERTAERRSAPDRRGRVAEAEALRSAALHALRLGDTVTAARLVAESDLLDPPQVTL